MAAAPTSLGVQAMSYGITKYQKHISSPLLDRIDNHIEVPRVEYDMLSDQRLGEPSSVIQKRISGPFQLSARAYHRILKLARTITDLAGSESIQPAHRTF